MQFKSRHLPHAVKRGNAQPGVGVPPWNGDPIWCIRGSGDPRRVKPTDVPIPATTTRSSTASGPARPTPTSPSTSGSSRRGATPTRTCSTASRTSSRASSGAPATGRASPPAAAGASTASRSRSAASSASPPTCATTSPSCLPEGARRRRTASASRCIGAGPASLTVANDLMPLGYEVVIFEKLERAGRPDAHQHPVVPPARAGARRGDRQDPRHGRRHPLQHARRRA